MSSSEQTPRTSNASRTQSTNSLPVAADSALLGDYEIEIPSAQGETNMGGPDVDNQDALDEIGYYGEPDAKELELEAEEKAIRAAGLSDSNDDVAVFADSVQDAFKRFETENSYRWQQSQPPWNTMPDEEQRAMLNEMEECMRYMTQEYSTAEMPDELVDRQQNSKLNPDAGEFHPTNGMTGPRAPDSSGGIHVTSWAPCVVTTYGSGQDDTYYDPEQEGFYYDPEQAGAYYYIEQDGTN